MDTRKGVVQPWCARYGLSAQVAAALQAAGVLNIADIEALTVDSLDQLDLPYRHKAALETALQRYHDDQRRLRERHRQRVRGDDVTGRWPAAHDVTRTLKSLDSMFMLLSHQEALAARRELRMRVRRKRDSVRMRGESLADHILRARAMERAASEPLPLTEAAEEAAADAEVRRVCQSAHAQARHASADVTWGDDDEAITNGNSDDVSSKKEGQSKQEKLKKIKQNLLKNNKVRAQQSSEDSKKNGDTTGAKVTGSGSEVTEDELSALERQLDATLHHVGRRPAGISETELSQLEREFALI